MLYGKTGGEGVVGGGRYLWYINPSEKVKNEIPSKEDKWNN
jgi:hypothetical protein